ncbi:MAG: PhzF family phenazine biosynthesis protein [Methylobacteriaceae bacterium]|nr:PhzF family phenazine biosynthesis protein [Methylobacteriaceae bacterium]
MKRRFFTLDVFADRPLAGNPLAVVLDSAGLDTAGMQAIAREFNLSETTFVLEPRDPVNSAAIRIFTPARELPFAGHPTIGSAVMIAVDRAPEMIGRGDLQIALEEEVGPVRCNVRRKGKAYFASFALPALPFMVPGAPDVPQAAAALGLAASEIGFDQHRISRYSCGTPYTFVPVSGLEAIARAAPDLARFRHIFGEMGVFLYTRETANAENAVHARMFAPQFGIIEDPATGSAAAAFAGVAQEFESPEDGIHTITIEQGFEMGRPSVINLTMDIAGGKLTAGEIGGSAVIVSQGTIDV